MSFNSFFQTIRGKTNNEERCNFKLIYMENYKSFHEANHHADGPNKIHAFFKVEDKYLFVDFWIDQTYKRFPFLKFITHYNHFVPVDITVDDELINMQLFSKLKDAYKHLSI